MPQGSVDWALEALRVARVVFYSIDDATGFMMRSGNCCDVLGVSPAGPVAGWLDTMAAADRPRYEEARRNLSPAAPSFPEFSGFGTLIIASSAAIVAQRFGRDGLVCKLEFPL